MRAPERRRRQYYLAAATFWLGAMQLQRDRCTVPRDKGLFGLEVDAHRADMDFFVVAVKRLREVACQARDRLPDSGAIRGAIERFDRRWPDLVSARNYSEHILGPSGSIPGGNVWYFTDSIVGPGPRGEPRYVVDIRDTPRSAEELFEALRDFLGPEAVIREH
jgi:hypothetical protein